MPNNSADRIARAEIERLRTIEQAARAFLHAHSIPPFSAEALREKADAKAALKKALGIP